MKCRKCRKNKNSIKGLCKNCYNKYNYHHRVHNVSLEDFISGNYIKHHPRKESSKDVKIGYSKLIEDYKNLILTKKMTMTDYCKQNNISRQTIYERLAKYKRNNLF